MLPAPDVDGDTLPRSSSGSGRLHDRASVVAAGRRSARPFEAPAGLRLAAPWSSAGEPFTIAACNRSSCRYPKWRSINDLRPDRSHVCAIAIAWRGDADLGRTPDWASDLERAGLRAGCGVWSRFRPGTMGELYIAGCGCCAGLSGACGVDGGAVCCGPAWRCGLADVPERGPGALALRRRAGVLRARAMADQASGATGSSLARSRLRCCVRQVLRRPLWCCGARAGRRGSLVTWLRLGQSIDPAPLRTDLGLSLAGAAGACCDGGAGSSAIDAERQARPPCAACAGVLRRRAGGGVRGRRRR